jgi:hypothetical protein
MGQATTAPQSAGQHLGYNTGRPSHGRQCSTGKARYEIIEDEEGPNYPRISAVNAADVEIAGAFQRPHRPHWLLYVTPLLAATAGVDSHPDHLLLRNRDEARHWVHFLADLYARAAS